MSLLGFDFGEKRIGVAVGHLETRLATPLAVLHELSNDERFARIAALIAEWQPSALVVGLPVHMDGTEHELTRLARKFGNRLTGRFGLPVEFADERLTSAVADDLLREIGKKARARKEHLDAVAACQILQAWLDSQP